MSTLVSLPPPVVAVAGFGRLLRLHRTLGGWSLAQLARTVGVDPSYISRLECGNRLPSAPVVRALCTGLGLTDADAQHFALVAFGMLEGDPIADALEHAATVRQAEAVLAACPCGACTARRAG
jgi:transcriptional regulator with XRE-family HTH domain